MKPYNDVSHVGLHFRYEPVISLCQHSEHDHLIVDRMEIRDEFSEVESQKSHMRGGMIRGCEERGLFTQTIAAYNFWD